ncbi:bifunctional Delta(1)-pyrroline-2-carboxylate/Delta(1)-piperideine-2-carboxylate reductase [Pseudovibrio exalbescens]|uniref:Ornithine cyclodeaminase n=1 Tax=Pseudovibrio exalbescens TaxID=197461 RepID=A0A1U7JFI1_9HYPH|nr:ornithine cyclodeaminase family protein [Pseudovibrio exalbescens]OKL43516.1 ornithine cyclodeaminase [Pseudovibrio exalbescens]
MLLLSADETRANLPYPALVEELRQMFKTGCEMPLRHHHDVAVPGEPDATLLLMPAWQPGAYVGVKLASVFPGNSERGLPAISASYVLSSGKTGETLALVDGGELTARRTAAASALAADYLARADSEHLVMVGTGRLSLNLIAAHKAVRPIKSVAIWGRNPEKAEAIAKQAGENFGIKAWATTDLQSACAKADIVSAATLSTSALIKGDWLPEGVHVDLVGAFKPSMRETDEIVIMKGCLFADTREGALKEGGDYAIPLQEGTITPDAILADLYDLCRGTHEGRRQDKEITVFKSVGAALEDLAGAILAYKNAVSKA